MKKLLSVLFGVLSIALVFSLATSANAQGQMLSLQRANSTSLSRDLTVGISGADVTTLQNFLISQGYNIGGSATGYFGEQTRAALASYQALKSIVPSNGYLGAVTRSAIQADVAANFVGPVAQTLPSGCTSLTGYSSTTGLACVSPLGSTLSLLPAQNPIASSNITVSTNGMHVPLVSFNLKSDGGASKITGINVVVNASGTQPTTIYLYSDGEIISSKTYPALYNGVAISFDNLSSMVSLGNSRVFTIKASYSESIAPGSSVFVNVNPVDYVNSNNLAKKTTQNRIYGTQQYFTSLNTTYPAGCTSTAGYSSTTGLACGPVTINGSYPVNLLPSSSPITSNSYVTNANNVVDAVPLANFTLNVLDANATITSIPLSLITTGAASTDLYLYAGTELIASKAVAGGWQSMTAGFVFDNLNYPVSALSNRTLTVKGRFAMNGSSGGSAKVNVNAISYKVGNGTTQVTTNGSVIGSTQYFAKSYPQITLANQPTASVITNPTTGLTTSMNATFTFNVKAIGGNVAQQGAFDYTVKYVGASSTVLYPVSTQSVVTIPNNNIANGSTAQVTVTASVLGSNIPASGLYAFGISEIKYSMDGVPGTINTGLDAFHTGAVRATVASTTLTQLSLSASPNPIPSASNVFNSYDGARGVSFTNFNVKSSGGDSSIVGVTASITASGTLPTTLYLYSGAGLVASKAITPGNNNVDFGNLNILVAKDTFQTLLIKGDFPANGNSGSMAIVNINAVSYQSSNGVLNKTSNGSVIGAPQYFLKAAPKVVLTGTPTASSTVGQNGQTLALTATFPMNVTAVGGNMGIPYTSDFVVKYTDGQPGHVYTATNISVATNNNTYSIPDGTTTYVLVTAMVYANAIPSSGLYTFYLDSINYRMDGVAGVLNYGLENFKTPNAVMAIVSGTASTSLEETNVTPCPSPIPMLSINATVGDNNDTVHNMKCFLNTKGYLNAKYLNSYFGNNTKIALAAYQTSKGIQPNDGINFGPITRAAMNADIGSGTTLGSITITAPNGGIFDNGPTQTIIVGWNPYAGDFDNYGVTLGNSILGVEQNVTPEYINKLSNGFNITSGDVQSKVTGWSGRPAPQEGYYFKVYAVKRDYAGIRNVAVGKSNLFSIKTGQVSPITVISPNGGEIFEKGKKYNISWTTKVSSNVSEVQIGLVDTRVIADTDVREMTIAQKIPNTGSYSWTVPNSFGNLSSGKVEGKNYQIIVYPYNAGQGDSSDANFTITASAQPYITIGAPNGGETWTRGTSQLIQWKYTDPNRGTCNTPGVYCTPEPQKSYDIQLVPTSQACAVGTNCAAVISPYNVATGVMANSYNWSVGSVRGGIDDGNYTVQVCISGTTTCGSGASYFKIVTTPSQSSIAVTSPNGGETWTRGATQTLKWKDSSYSTCGNTGGTYCTPGFVAKFYDVKMVPVQAACPPGLGCTQALISPYPILTSMGATEYNWEVGNYYVQGVRNTILDGSYYMQVCESGTDRCGKSDNYFKITSTSNTIPSISILTPNGNSYAARSTILVGWSQNYDSSNIIANITNSQTGLQYYSGSIGAGTVGKNASNLPAEASNIPAAQYTLSICDNNKQNPVATYKPLCASSQFTITNSTNSQPNITSITPTSGPAGTSVTVYGANFNLRSIVLIGDNVTTATPTYVSTDGTKILFNFPTPTSPAASTYSVRVSNVGNVSVASGLASNSATFTITPTTAAYPGFFMNFDKDSYSSGDTASLKLSRADGSNNPYQVDLWALDTGTNNKLLLQSNLSVAQGTIKQIDVRQLAIQFPNIKQPIILVCTTATDDCFGQAGASRRNSTFISIVNTSASITIISPNGGEAYTINNNQIYFNLALKMPAGNKSVFSAYLIPSDDTPYNHTDEQGVRGYAIGGTSGGNTGDINTSWSGFVGAPGKYKLRVYLNNYSGQGNYPPISSAIAKDESDGYFTVTAPATTTVTLGVISPNGGESYPLGGNIAVSANLIPGKPHYINLVDGSKKTAYELASSVTGPASGPYTFTTKIPASITSGTQFKIEVCGGGSPTCAYSASNFSIIQPTYIESSRVSPQTSPNAAAVSAALEWLMNWMKRGN